MKTIINLFLTLLILLSFNAKAQLEVYGYQMDSIGKIVEQNPQYIIDLNEKCMNMDSSMTKYELFLLYYGSTFIDGYKPYSESLSTKVIGEYMDDAKYDEVVSVCNSAIKQHPAFIKPYYYLGAAYYEKGDTALSGKYFDRYFDLLRIPYNSGKGETFDNAFVVRSVADEYILIGELGYHPKSQALVYDKGMPFDLMYLSKPDDTTSYKLYFNVNQPLTRGLVSLLGDDSEDKDSINNSVDESEKKRFWNIFRRKKKDK